MSEKLSDFICWCASFLLLAASLTSLLLRRERSDARSKNPTPLRSLQQKAHRLSLYLQGRWQAILRRDVL